MIVQWYCVGTGLYPLKGSASGDSLSLPVHSRQVVEGRPGLPRGRGVLVAGLDCRKKTAGAYTRTHARHRRAGFEERSGRDDEAIPTAMNERRKPANQARPAAPMAPGLSSNDVGSGNRASFMNRTGGR